MASRVAFHCMGALASTETANSRSGDDQLGREVAGAARHRGVAMRARSSAEQAMSERILAD